MIKATKLQEEYRRHLNRLNTDCEKSVSISDGDAYINEAIDIIFENLVVKFEINDLVRNHLRQLEVSNHKIIHYPNITTTPTHQYYIYKHQHLQRH